MHRDYYAQSVRPTAQGLHIGHERHAIAVIEATHQHPEMFPLISRRPGQVELNKVELDRVICHGNAFVFTPSADNGLVRWSDCKRWGKSRQYKPFFRYFEAMGRITSGTAREHDPNSPEDSTNDTILSTYSGLVKWTYTVNYTPDLDRPDYTVQYRLVWYVDPKRRHELRPLSAVYPLRDMDIPWAHYGPLCFEPVAPRGRLSQEGNGLEDSLPYDYRTRPPLQFVVPSERAVYQPQPTFQMLDIRTEDQAILLIEATRQLAEQYPLVKGRPAPEDTDRAAFERLITHGNAFVYAVTDGLVRWHDFKRWTNSHSLPPFLRYDQVSGTTRRGVPPAGRSSTVPQSPMSPADVDDPAAGRLQRWTYSAHFTDGGGTLATLYRLVWYVDPARRHELQPVASVSELRTLSVPWHYYQRWNGERHSPGADVAASASPSAGTPRRIAPRQSRPMSPTPSASSSRSQWPISPPPRPMSVQPTLPPLSQLSVHDPRNERTAPRGGEQGNVLPPLRTPLPRVTTSVRGVGYQQTGWMGHWGGTRDG